MKQLFILLICIPLNGISQVNLKSGLRAYYPFSGNAQDLSGYNNHPVFNNAALTSDRFGIPKSAYHFNGRSNFMKILNTPGLNTINRLSISIWVKPMGFYAGKCHGNSILMKGDEDYLAGSYFLRFDDGQSSNGENCYSPVDRWRQNFYGPGAYVGTPGYTPFIKTNQWYNLILTYDGITARLYIDCKLVSSKPQGSTTFTNRYDIFLGRHNSNEYPYWFNGDLDELRIYNRPLSKDEIRAICTEKPELRSPDKKPEYVKTKEKKDTDPAKTKTGSLKLQTASVPPPLINISKTEEANTGFIKLQSYENEQEILLEDRKKDLAQEITVDTDSLSITLYDNGEIDGDSVTLIYNDKVLTTHQRLTDKPLTFFIKIDRGPNSRNELVMYAENLGSIPPNTALMVIYDGKKRYELNIKSTEKTNGAVSFKLRE